MRRQHILVAAAGLALALTTAGVATAVPAEIVREKVTYEIVDGVAYPYVYPGDYGFEQCVDENGDQRTYALYDGTLKQKITYTYTPSKAAFDAEEPGASMTAEGTSQFKGLFDRDYSGEAIFVLQPRSGLLRGGSSRTFNTDGTVTQTDTYIFSGEWIDTTTGESTGDYYNIDGTFTEVADANGDVITSTFDGVSDGTCLRIDQ